MFWKIGDCQLGGICWLLYWVSKLYRNKILIGQDYCLDESHNFVETNPPLFSDSPNFLTWVHLENSDTSYFALVKIGSASLETKWVYPFEFCLMVFIEFLHCYHLMLNFFIAIIFCFSLIDAIQLNMQMLIHKKFEYVGLWIHAK